MALCPPCSDLSQRWLDTKPSTHVAPGISIQSHAAYDDTPAGMRDNTWSRHQRWAALVREQRAAVAQICRAQEHGDHPDQAAARMRGALDAEQRLAHDHALAGGGA